MSGTHIKWLAGYASHFYYVSFKGIEGKKLASRFGGSFGVDIPVAEGVSVGLKTGGEVGSASAKPHQGKIFLV